MSVALHNRVVIDDRPFLTNAPPDIMPINLLSNWLMQYGKYQWAPAELDRLETGTYYWKQAPNHIWERKPASQIENLELRPSVFGKVISLSSFGEDSYGRNINTGNMLGDSTRLLTRLGFEIVDSPQKGLQITGLPTPATFKAGAAYHDFPVELLPFGDIPARHYLEVFARGFFPVATGDEYHYIHDTSSSHAVAMMLGGPPLRELLAETAQAGLSGDNTELQKQVTDGLDFFTSAICGLIVPMKGTLEEGYALMLDYAEHDANIAPERSQAVLQFARRRAAHLDIAVRE